MSPVRLSYASHPLLADVSPVTSDLLPDGSICGPNTQNRIYGGEKTDLDEFPWMALVEYEKRTTVHGRKPFYCVGFLQPEAVEGSTAAEC